MKENETERGRERECRERGDFCCWWFDVIMRFRGYNIGRHCLTQAIIFRCDN